MEGWAPTSNGAAFALAALACACWGSWSNATKPTQHVAFAFFYLDWSIAVFLTGAGFFFSLGASQLFLDDTDGWTYIGLEALAGILFNIANVMLVIGIKRAGLAVAFPIGIGMALVLGTILTYVQDPKGSPELLFVGVTLAFFAVLSMAKSSHEMKQRNPREVEPLMHSEEDEGAAENSPATAASSSSSPSSASSSSSSTSNIILCLVCGFLMSTWSPLNAKAIGSSSSPHLSSYGAFLLFTVAVLLSTLPLCAFLLRFVRDSPLSDNPPVGHYLKLPLRDHLFPLLGGFIWALGTLANSVSGGLLGFATSFAIGNSAPMVATLWGLLYFQEFKGASRMAYFFVGLTLFLYVNGIICIALSQS